MNRQPAAPLSTDGLFPAAVVLAVVIAALAGLLGVEEIAARFVRGNWPVLSNFEDGAGAALAWVRSPSAPEHAWPAAAAPSAPGRGLYWTALALGVALEAGVVIAGVWAWMRLRGPGAAQGFATGASVRTALSARAARRLGRVVLPGPTPPALDECGLYLGCDGSGRALWATREDSIVVIGPPRSGKTRMLAMPLLRRAVGPQVVVSAKQDLLEHLAFLETRRGEPLWVVDLQGPVGLDGRPRPQSPVAVHGYDLVTPCRHLATARLTAETFVALVHAQSGATSGSTALGGEWRARGVQVLTGVLHAGALARRDAHWVHRVVATESLRTAADVLAAQPAAARGWSEVLLSIDRLPAETRGGVLFAAAAALSALDDPDVRDLLSSGGPRPMFDVDELVTGGRGRLFVIAGVEQAGLAAVATILVERIIAAAKARAARLPHERLVPPLLVCIDEMAESCPLRSAAELTQSGGGRGITPVFLFQAPSQMRTAWDHDRAATILSNATAKIVLGGLGDSRDLEAIAKLLPEVARPTRSRSSDRAGRYSTNEGERWVSMQSAAELREQRSGRATLLFRALRPIQVRLTRWREGGHDADSRALGAARRSYAAARDGRRREEDDAA